VKDEFEEISHSGGKITFRVVADQQGRRGLQTTISGDRPVPAEWIAVYALPQGVAVESIMLRGIGQPLTPPPFPGCFPVFIASDSEGKFGHNCPNCGSYWRSGPWPNICPYCAMRAAGFQFLAEAQQRYVRQYCEVLASSLASTQDGEVVIDMDAVSDALATEGDKPAFYVSEQSQQRKFTCKACEEFNDILGRFGYCSLCGTRNDLADFEDQTVPAIRNRLNSGNAPEDCVRDAVASFDSFMAQYAKQLVNLIPLSERRRNRLLTRSFHKLDEVRDTFNSWFDIDVCAGMKENECRFVEIMFYRRHVYEHNGGEVDQEYLDNSGDNTVRLKQHIRETQQSAHDLLGSLVKMARNVHRTFHELHPPIPEPIKTFEERKAHIARYAKGG
jgi:hypothetical protein